jgi:chitinase
MLSPDDAKIPNGAHPRGLKNQAEFGTPGDLSGSWGQQLAFNQLLASGALVKMPDGTYTAANGYTMGGSSSSLDSKKSAINFA